MKIIKTTIISLGGLTAFFMFMMFSCAETPESNDHGFNGLEDGVTYNNDDLTWKRADLTWFESFPDPDSEECIYFNGCDYVGQMAYFGETSKTESWVSQTHIAAVHLDDWPTYSGKILRVRQGSHQIDLKVYDLCNDDDCSGCCSENSSNTGFLIDMEKYTYEKFNGYQGEVEWVCLDCD